MITLPIEELSNLINQMGGPVLEVSNITSNGKFVICILDTDTYVMNKDELELNHLGPFKLLESFNYTYEGDVYMALICIKDGDIFCKTLLFNELMGDENSHRLKPSFLSWRYYPHKALSNLVNQGYMDLLIKSLNRLKESCETLGLYVTPVPEWLGMNENYFVGLEINELITSWCFAYAIPKCNFIPILIEDSIRGLSLYKVIGDEWIDVSNSMDINIDLPYDDLSPSIRLNMIEGLIKWCERET